MSVDRKIAFGAVATWFNRGTSILLGLVLTPILFRTLPREELGVWLLLGQSWAVLGIFDLGLGVTLTRRVAFAVSEARKSLTGSDQVDSARHLSDLVETGKKAYEALAFFAFVVAFAGGFFSLKGIHLTTVQIGSVWVAWAILCLSQAWSVWAAVWDCVLQGSGYVGWDAVVGAVTASATLVVQIVVALAHGGLVGLAIAAALGSLAQRFLVRGLAKRKRPDLFSLHGQFQWGYLKSLAPLALKAWITSVATVVVLNSDQFFVAGLQGAATFPAYRAAYVVFVNINMLAVTVTMSSGVFIAQLWRAGDIAGVHRLVYQNLRIGLIIMAVGGASVLGLGGHLFNVWVGHGNFVGASVSAVFFALQFLEVQSYILSTSARATEDEAYAGWACAAAVLKIVLSLALGSRFGLIGIAAATLCAQVSTSYWYMWYRGLFRLRIPPSQYLRRVAAPVAVVFVATLGSIAGLANWMKGSREITIVGVCLMASASILALAFWTFVLDPDQKRLAASTPEKLLRKLRRYEFHQADC